MTGKEVLFKTLRHEETERPAWVPMAGVHAGFLKGYTADEVYQDADKLVESLLEVEKMYAPDGLILLFDLQLEAEILGCTIKWEKIRQEKRMMISGGYTADREEYSRIKEKMIAI